MIVISSFLFWGKGMAKLVCGIGYNSGKYTAYEDGKITNEYTLWANMLYRCTKKYWIKNPTYTGTTCSDNFKSFEYFYEWCQEQPNFTTVDDGGFRWCLDKDFLSGTGEDGKIYSEDTCVFIPQQINKLLNRRRFSRGSCPVGVCLNKQTNKYQAQCSIGLRATKGLGGFNTAEEAFQAYKIFKESLIKEVAKKYKDVLDVRVYQKLIKYEITIMD